VAEGSPARLDVEGTLTATAGKLDLTEQRVFLTGGSPKVDWIEQKTALEAAEITVLLAKAEPEAKSNARTVERVVLHGGSPKISSEKQGLTLEASDIAIVPAKVKGQGPIESASATGDAHLVQSQGANRSDTKAQSIEISDNGDKVILTGVVAMNVNYPQYQGLITGDAVTATGLRSAPGSVPGRHIVAESNAPGNALAAAAGVFDAQAQVIDVTEERVILRGGAPKATLVQHKSSVEAGVITILLIRTDSGQLAVDQIHLREGSPRLASEEQGITLTASQIDLFARNVEGESPIQSATAKGSVHMVQAQDENHADATAEALELKDNGDTAVLSGNVVATATTPQNSSRVTGNVVTVTGLLAKAGKPATPLFAVQGQPALLHVVTKTHAAPPKAKPARK
jgi:lipopolysaccharide export system protein LptA